MLQLGTVRRLEHPDMKAVIAGDVPIAIMSALRRSVRGRRIRPGHSCKYQKDPARAFLVTAKGISQPAQLKEESDWR